MTLVEISGIISLEDARHAIDAGSHALHFNFPAHPRAGTFLIGDPAAATKAFTRP